jgi:hypothetical protein
MTDQQRQQSTRLSGDNLEGGISQADSIVVGEQVETLGSDVQRDESTTIQDTTARKTNLFADQDVPAREQAELRGDPPERRPVS